MAKKAELLEKAAELKLEVSEKNTIAEIEAAIAGAEKHEVREAVVAKAGKRSEKALKEAEERPRKKPAKKLATLRRNQRTLRRTSKRAQSQLLAHA